MQAIRSLPVMAARPWTGPTRVGPSASAPAAAHETTAAAEAHLGGAVGAAVGAVGGRLLLPVGGAAGLETLAHLALAPAALPGPIGIGLAAVAGLTGLVGGIALEAKTRAGRLVGGMAGGVLGSAAGGALGLAGVRPSARTEAVTQRFSLQTLPGRLLDPSYEGATTIRDNPTAAAALQAARPGDVLLVPAHIQVVNTLEKLAGGTGNYGHAGLVDEGGKILDLVDRGGRERPRSAWMSYTQLAVVRPHYRSPQESRDVIEQARAREKVVQYDDTLTMPKPGQPADDREYCTEFVYNRLQEKAPEIRLEPKKVLGERYVLADTFYNSPDVDVVYDSGSNYWLNYLSRFC